METQRGKVLGFQQCPGREGPLESVWAHPHPLPSSLQHPLPSGFESPAPSPARPQRLHWAGFPPAALNKHIWLRGCASYVANLLPSIQIVQLIRKGETKTTIQISELLKENMKELSADQCCPKSPGLGVGQTWVWIPAVPVGLQAADTTSQSLPFLICQVKMLIPASQGCWEVHLRKYPGLLDSVVPWNVSPKKSWAEVETLYLSMWPY